VINLKVRCRLRRQIPIGLNVHPLIRLRIEVIQALTRPVFYIGRLPVAVLIPAVFVGTILL
jgi:hypothetical protein